MQKKTLLIAALTLSATLAGFVVAGSALGADWHEYQGRVTAGQAYLVPIPKGAESLSFALTPTGESPSAKLVVFDAEDDRVGYFALEGDGSTSDIVDPLTGDYVLYVYELKQADLSIRLQAKSADDLRVAKAETLRTDKIIVRGHEGDALAKDITVKVKSEPVFTTLLYQGSVENLNAAIESPLGVVLTVSGESGVSYSPGIGVGAASARDAMLENLAGGIHKVTVSADAFDGDLYLTTLTYARPLTREAVEPVAPTTEGSTPAKAPPAPHAMPEFAIEPNGAALKEGVPVAADVTKSTLALALPSAFMACPPAPEPAPEADDEESDKNETDAHSQGKHEKHASHDEVEGCAAAKADAESDEDYYAPWGPEYGYSEDREHALVTVFDGADGLVGHFVLDSEESPVVILEDLTPGEYVLFVRSASHAEDEDTPVAYLVDPEDPEAPVAYREIALVENSLSLGRQEAPVGHYFEMELDMPTPPLMLGAYAAPESSGVDYRFRVASPSGVVFASDSIVQFGGGGFMTYSEYGMEHLVAGSYLISEEALSYWGETTLVWETYDRGFAFGAKITVDNAEEAAEEDEEDEEDDGEPASVAQPLGALAGLVRGLF